MSASTSSAVRHNEESGRITTAKTKGHWSVQIFSVRGAMPDYELSTSLLKAWIKRSLPRSIRGNSCSACFTMRHAKAVRWRVLRWRLLRSASCLRPGPHRCHSVDIYRHHECHGVFQASRHVHCLVVVVSEGIEADWKAGGGRLKLDN